MDSKGRILHSTKTAKITSKSRLTSQDSVNSIPDIHTSFQTYVHLWIKFNGAGSLFMQELCTLLGTIDAHIRMPPSTLAGISLESQPTLLKTVQEMDSLLLEYCRNNADNKQNLTRSILLYIKLQCQYHAACRDALDRYVDQLTNQYHEDGNEEMLKTLQKLDLNSTDLNQPVNDPQPNTRPTSPHLPARSQYQISTETTTSETEKSSQQGSLASEDDIENIISFLSSGFIDIEASLPTPTPDSDINPTHESNPNFLTSAVQNPFHHQVPTSSYFTHQHPSFNILPSQSFDYPFHKTNEKFWFPPHQIDSQAPRTNFVPAILQPHPGTVARPNNYWPVSSGGHAINTGTWDPGPDSADESDDSSTCDPNHNNQKLFSAKMSKDAGSDEELLNDGFFVFRPQSLENLGRQTVTSWPLQEVYHSNVVVSDLYEPRNVAVRTHRPLQVHYSDPMSNTADWRYFDMCSSYDTKKSTESREKN